MAGIIAVISDVLPVITYKGLIRGLQAPMDMDKDMDKDKDKDKDKDNNNLTGNYSK